MSRIKIKDAELASQLANFEESFSSTFQTLAGISTAEMASFTTQIGAYQNGLVSAVAAKAASKSAVQAKDTAKKTVRNAFQRITDKIYATASITDSNLASFGLPPRNGPSISVPPSRVTDVTGEASSDGTARIRWNRTGNPRSTLFVIQASEEGGPFVQIGQTLRTSFKDINAVPGVEKSYRIVATNNLGRSQPSEAVTIYPNGGFGSIQLAS